MKYKTTWTWQNASEGRDPNLGCSIWMKVSGKPLNADTDDAEEFSYETYVSYSLPIDFEREDLKHYENFGLDGDTFYADVCEYRKTYENCEVAEAPCITDDKYNLDGEKYGTWEIVAGFTNILEIAKEDGASEDVKQSILDCYFNALCRYGM